MGWEYSIGFHKKLLSCSQRNRKFQKAIHAAINHFQTRSLKPATSLKNIKRQSSQFKPKPVSIADLGSGTGFLSFVSERAGAQKVHMVESDSHMMALSKAIAKKNYGAHTAKKFSFINKDITAIKTVPKKYQSDIIISETLGTWPFEEGLLSVMKQAPQWKKSQDSILIPSSISQFVAPIFQPDISQKLEKWSTDIQQQFQIDFSLAHRSFSTNLIATEIPQELVDVRAIQEFNSVDLSDIQEVDPLLFHIKFPPFSRPIYGFAFWWESVLFDDIILSTSPWDPETHWKQAYLPLIQPIPADRQVTLNIETHTAEGFDVAWTVDINQKIHEHNYLNLDSPEEE